MPAIDDNDVLDSVQAAKLLRVARGTLLAECRANRVPCQRVGHQWRFSRRALLAWLEAPEPTRQATDTPVPAQPEPAPKAKGKRTLKQGQLDGLGR